MALGQIDYGLYGLIGGLTAFIAFFNSILASANSRFYAYSVGSASVADDKVGALEECRHWFNTALSVHLVIPLILIMLGYPLGRYAIEHWLTIPIERVGACIWVLRFVCVSCFVAMINVPFTAMYTAKQYIAELTIYSFVTSTLNVIVLYYMVTHPAEWLVRFAAWACMLTVVPQIIICVRALLIFPECKIIVAYMWNRDRLRRIAAFSLWQAMGNFCGLLRTQGMSIVVNKFFGATMNAAQTIGNTVQGHCFTLAAAMQGAFVPVITQACGAKDFRKMNEYVIRVCKFNMILSLLFIIPISLELPMVLKLWLKNPPEFAIGLCYCAMAHHLVSACTVGHMVAVNASGKIAAYYVVLSLISIFTLPIAVVIGLLWRNVYAIMGVVVVMECLNSIGRILFARREVGASVRKWLKDVLRPTILVVITCVAIGSIPKMWMQPSLSRVLSTSMLCVMSFVPIIWFGVLSLTEKAFVRGKIMTLKTMFMAK